MRTIYAMVLVCLLTSPAVAGEGYITGSLGASLITKMPPDGTWHQDGLPATANKTDLSYKLGAGYRWDRWYVEGNYVHMGGFSTQGTWVSDDDYDPSGHIAKSREHTASATMSSQMHGGEVLLGYQYPVTDWLSMQVHAGAWGGAHKIKAALVADWDHRTTWGGEFNGMQIGATAGAGVCLGSAWQVCGDVSYYKTLAETKYPVAKDVLLPAVTVRIPLPF